MGKRKNPAAVALGRKGGEARREAMTPEQRIASARHAVLLRYGRAEPPGKWYGLFTLDNPTATEELVAYSRSKDELRERARSEPERGWIIDTLDYDPRTCVGSSSAPLVAKYEPDAAAQLRALQDLQELATEKVGQR